MLLLLQVETQISKTFNDTLRESLSSSMGGTYTIGGSTGKDYATITAAEAALAQYGVCAPIVFNMEQGDIY